METRCYVFSQKRLRYRCFGLTALRILTTIFATDIEQLMVDVVKMSKNLSQGSSIDTPITIDSNDTTKTKTFLTTSNP